MELVYLWVEEYKNIKEQGFNFSPRFDCKYDKKTNELTIKDKSKDYINIFPDNINITAIVGENGSGKSSLISYIIQHLNPHKDGNKEPWSLACWLDYKKNKIYIQTSKEIIIPDKIESITIEQNKTGFTNEILKSFFYIYNNNNTDIEEDNDNEIFEGYEFNPDYIIHREVDKRKNIINLDIEHNKTTKNFIKYLENTNTQINNITNPFFTPNYLFLNKENFLKKYVYNYSDSNTNKYIQLDRNTQLKADNIIYLKNHFKEEDYNYTYEPYIKIKEVLENLSGEDDNSLFNTENINNVYKCLFDKSSDILEGIKDTKENIKDSHNNSNDVTCELLAEIEKVFKLVVNNEKLIQISKNIIDEGYPINITKVDSNIKDFIKELPSYIKVDFLDEKGHKFSHLSSGEQSLLKLIYSIENIICSVKKESKSINIFLDEIENTLHPNWQKKLINWLIIVGKNYDKQINFFICSHSPFILSDIPKENVIFLKREEETGKCINLSEKVDIEETFGQNIHTLLSDSFFIDNGLMGEFAKGKIEEIKEFYELVKSFEDYIKKNKKPYIYIKLIYLIKIKKFRHIQSIIGEPFLQTIIKNYLDEITLILSNDKTLIDNEINQLKAKIEKLEGLKNG